MPKQRELTPKQQQFVDTFDGVVASTAKKIGISEAYAYRLNKDVLVLEAIRKKDALRTNGVAAKVMETMKLQAFWSDVIRSDGTNGQKEQPMPYRLKASELLGKSKAMFTENISVKHDLATQLKGMTDAEIEARLRNLEGHHPSLPVPALRAEQDMGQVIDVTEDKQ